MHGLLPGEVVIAVKDNFGMKLFSANEIEIAVRHGVAFKPAPVLFLGWEICKCQYP